MPEENQELEAMELEKRKLLYQQMQLLAEKSKEETVSNDVLCELSDAMVNIYKADRIIF